MPNGLLSPASMDNWMQMLDQMQESLDRAVREVEEHERSLAEAEADADGSRPDAGRRYLDQIDERLRGLEGHQEVSSRLAADVEELLADDERVANEWAGRAAATRRRLEGMVVTGIS